MAATDLFRLSSFLFLAMIAIVWLTAPRKSAVAADAADAGGAH